ncbi:hypothetical protein C2E21_4317 [Chlorella sorokiniana]|uniref:Uncharacterized protein n=1 Tax=Chlorella sorokiniana TaxID=3076 RepID=A0A2P6TS59_CHLSO|nr:hypothetical protein C2E21_4317 [Chlorella sorokiniana]|eukprot:PRW56897.1 hypothetical protein C2E21_4317 [Chlorella sorokiniana]
MEGASTLDQIEADLRFCEDVLNSASQLPSKHQPRRPGSYDAATAAAAKQQRGLPTRPSPLRPAAAAAPTARTTAELLDMLSNVPEGQPFEIDTRLLYSPRSSYVASGATSPSGRSMRSSHDGGWADLGLAAVQHPHAAQRQQQGGRGDGSSQFSLPAYRASTEGQHPLFAGVEEAAAALGPLHGDDPSPWRSQQHAAGPPTSTQQQQQQWNGRQQRPSSGAAGRLAAVSPSGSLGSLGSGGARPVSAPQRGPGASGSRQGRQLLLDDALALGIKGSTAELLRQGREERLAQLSQPRTHLWQRCAQIKAAEEREELQECTFAPRTGRPPSRQRLAPGLPVEDRLALSQAGRREALERARMEREQEALSDCTFAPQLVTQPERHLQREYTPLHRRLGEEQKRRSAKLAQARVQQGLGDADLTFQPQLNQRSLKLAAEREARELFEDSTGAGQRPRSAGARSAAGGDPEERYTFSPAINPASERLLEDSTTVPSDFQERLRYYSLRKQLKQRAAAAAAGAEACTFRPDTGNAVQVLALSAARAGQVLESEQERYERLAGEEAARLAAKRAAKEAEVYGSMDFKPQLNPRSLALAPAGSGGVQALASADRQRAKLEELRAEEEARQRAECTFQPDTSKPRVKGYYNEYQPPQPSATLSIAGAAKQGFEGLTQRIAEYQAERDARAAAARAEEEEQRLRECSFAPDINRTRVQAKGPVLVRGLDRHLELRQLADRRRAEADARAARVFHANPRTKQGATVPQPFQLRGHALLEAKAAQKQAAALQSALGERMQACTFKPQTNHARRREQLARLLGEGEDADLAAPLQDGY